MNTLPLDAEGRLAALVASIDLARRIADELAAGEWVSDKLIADYRRAKREAEGV